MTWLIASSLIVTVYGDAIEPHGGAVWLGSLIQLLEPIGINERLIRTSIFRLTKEGWLTAEKVGRDPKSLPVGISSHGFIASDSQDARDIAFPAHSAAMSRIGKERGWPPTTRAQFDAGATPQGAYFMGSPQQVIDKILMQHEWFNHDRFGLQLSVGTLPHDKVMKAIELYGQGLVQALTDVFAVLPRQDQAMSLDENAHVEPRNESG